MAGATYRPEGLLLHSQENREQLTPSGLLAAAQSGKILEARAVLCDEAHNLEVRLPGGIRGVIPRAETALGIEDGTTRDIAIITRVGKPVCFKVLRLQKDESGRATAILSRRAAQAECMERMVRQLRPGEIIDARVTHMEPFGCFVDIGCGIPSLITIDNISVSRISHPRDRFTAGQYIKTVVKSLDREGGRVILSHKELLGTWEENVRRFSVGQTAAGTVRSVESYGVFIELLPNLAGLADFKEGVLPGQQAAVYIKNIIPEKVKVKLILIDSFEAEPSPPVTEYFLTGGRLSRWVYTPEGCEKYIETVFE